MTSLTWTDPEPRPCVCRVCGHEGVGTLVAVVDAVDVGTIDVVRCVRCGSLDLVDEPLDGLSTEREIDDYVEVGAALSTIAQTFERVDTERVGRLLDVGCGFGFALDIARHAFGWTVVGVEPAPVGRRGALELDLDIRDAFLTAATDLGEPFDLILATEVVEHVTDPLGFLTALRSHLWPGGSVVLTTPAAEVVSVDSGDTAALSAIRPGFHTFLATADALSGLLNRAGFTHVEVSRVGETLHAMASTSAGPAAEVTSIDVNGYLRHRMDTSPDGSALALGMSVRLLRNLVASGHLDEADVVSETVVRAFERRHGMDLTDPIGLREASDRGERLPWTAVGALFALGSLELHHRDQPQRAAEYFSLARACATHLIDEAGIVDLDLADLLIQSTYHRAFALTRFDPAWAVDGAIRLDEVVDEDDPSGGYRVNMWRCRLFVELVARGYRAEVEPLAVLIRGMADITARSAVDECRAAGLDALYSLGVLERDTGHAAASQAAFIECINICDSRPAGDEHARALSALCRASLPPASHAEEPQPPRVSRWERLARRARHRALAPLTPRTSEPVASAIETFWGDTWGTYLDGWVHAHGPAVRQIVIESGGLSITASRHDRPDVAAIWPKHAEALHSGFSAYLPGHVADPITVVLRTDDGDITTDSTLPDKPRPEHPVTPSALPNRQFARAMKQAPPGPALALGVRALSAEIAQARSWLLGDREITGLDIHPGFGVDVVGDVHQLSSLFPANHFSVVYSAALLEHVAAPWLVAAECAKVLQVGGIVVHVAPWVWPTHSEPNDFWRFSDQGLVRLFNESLGFRTIASGGSGGAVITPTPDWRLEQIRMPTHSSPAMSWVIAEKVAEPHPAIAWPYTEQDVATAQEYPVDGLCDTARVE